MPKASGHERPASEEAGKFNISLTHRTSRVVGLSIVGVMLSVVPIGKHVAMNFVPVDDESRFEVNIMAPEGTALDPLRNKTWDLNSAKSVTNALAFH